MTATIPAIPGFKVLQELDRNELRSIVRAVSTEHGRNVRLTLFSPALSERGEFRAEFKKQRPLLQNLSHAAIPKFLGFGEADGCLYYFTSDNAAPTLAQRLADGQSFAWDEIADLGWQLASALQHAHNLGLSHGQLDAASVLVDSSLRVQISGFGEFHHERTDAAADGQSEWLDQVNHDLIALGSMLDRLVSSASSGEESGSETAEAVVRQLVEDLRDPHSPNFPVTARQIQGRLGNQLITMSGDSIELQDQREGMSHSGRSIVDELFDDIAPDRTSTDHYPDQIKAPVSPASWGVFIILAAIVAIVLLTFFLRG